VAAIRTFYLQLETTVPAIAAGPPGDIMRDFPDAVFVPETVEIMGEALDASVSTLPDPVTAAQVNLLAESILRTAQEGERDTAILQRMALLELTLMARA
jgi:hypothetical protein